MASFLDRLGLTRGATALATVTPIESARRGIASPWATGSLTEFVYSDVFGDATLYPPTRAQAMTLPAVVNGRALILADLAGRNLRALRDGAPIQKQPAWLYRTSGTMSPWMRMARTIDDLIFYGDSLWAIDRGGEGDGQIIDAEHLPRELWRINDRNQIEVTVDGTHWNLARSRDVIYFTGSFEGLLVVASRTIRAAINLEASWANMAATPMPALLLKQKEQGELDTEEVQKVVDGAAAARRSPNGPVMFVPWEYDPEVVGQTDSQMFSEARNAVKLDIANFLGLDASKLDAALPKASLNYETDSSAQTSFENRQPYWSGPIEARLSMDDVCPRGQYIAFDFSDDPRQPGDDTGPFKED